MASLGTIIDDVVLRIAGLMIPLIPHPWTTFDIRFISNFCKTCRRFYTLCAPLAYQDLVLSNSEKSDLRRNAEWKFVRLLAISIHPSWPELSTRTIARVLKHLPLLEKVQIYRDPSTYYENRPAPPGPSPELLSTVLGARNVVRLAIIGMPWQRPTESFQRALWDVSRSVTSFSYRRTVTFSTPQNHFGIELQHLRDILGQFQNLEVLELPVELFAHALTGTSLPKLQQLKSEGQVVFMDPAIRTPTIPIRLFQAYPSLKSLDVRMSTPPYDDHALNPVLSNIFYPSCEDDNLAVPPLRSLRLGNVSPQELILSKLPTGLYHLSLPAYPDPFVVAGNPFVHPEECHFDEAAECVIDDVSMLKLLRGADLSVLVSLTVTYECKDAGEDIIVPFLSSSCPLLESLEVNRYAPPPSSIHQTELMSVLLPALTRLSRLRTLRLNIDFKHFDLFTHEVILPRVQSFIRVLPQLTSIGFAIYSLQVTGVVLGIGTKTWQWYIHNVIRDGADNVQSVWRDPQAWKVGWI